MAMDETAPSEQPEQPGTTRIDTGGGLGVAGSRLDKSPILDRSAVGTLIVADTVHMGATAPDEAQRLNEALALLARLPLDQVPAIAPLPPGSHMPLSPNPLFVGRETELLALAAALKAG